jgi:hypothetical protein
MYVQPSAPRSIGGVLDDAIRLYRSALPKIWPLAVAAAVILVIPNIFFGLATLKNAALGPQAVVDMVKSPGLWLTYLLFILLYLVIYTAMISAINSVALGREAALGDSVSIGTRLMPRTFAAGVLMGLMIFVGCILLVIPGIYLWGIYQLAFVAIVIEDTGISDSFGVSRRLIKGYWWRSVTITSVSIVIVMVFSFLSGFIGALLSGLLGFNTVAGVVARAVVGGVVNLFVYAMLPCFLVAMYYDLKLRHEGGDLAARVDALAAR